MGPGMDAGSRLAHHSAGNGRPWTWRRAPGLSRRTPQAKSFLGLARSRRPDVARGAGSRASHPSPGAHGVAAARIRPPRPPRAARRTRALLDRTRSPGAKRGLGRFARGETGYQLLERGAHLLERTTTAPCYSLHALANTSPPKPGLVRREHGAAIEVEVWAAPVIELGSFVALVPPPLAIGNVELADGRWVKGF